MRNIIMDEIQVKFLEKEYLFPQEIKDYISYCQKIQKVNDNFLTVLTKRVQDRWYDYPDKEFEELFRESGKEVITLLSQDKIYDVTISELVDQNTGYISFQNITKAGFEKYKNIYVEATEEFIKGYENAQMIANSKVTGSGLTLYSSSLLAHMTFAALESNTVKKQVAKADKEYREAMAMLSKKNQTAQEKKENDFLYNELYPAYFGIVGEFVSELLEKYLNILYKHSVYDYPKVKAYNIQKSTELLKNLDIVDDKKEVLALAFENCPYNDGVYQKVVDLGYMDLDTFRTLQILGKEDNVINSIQSYCVSQSNSIEILDNYISILAVAKNENKEKLCDELYAAKIENIVQHYQNLNDALSTDENLNVWVRMNICNDVDRLLETTENEIISKVNKKINRFSDNNELFAYIDKGLLSFKEIRRKDSNAENLDQINSEYCQAFYERIQHYLFQLKVNKIVKKPSEPVEGSIDNNIFCIIGAVFCVIGGIVCMCLGAFWPVVFIIFGLLGIYFNLNDIKNKKSHYEENVKLYYARLEEYEKRVANLEEEKNMKIK